MNEKEAEALNAQLTRVWAVTESRFGILPNGQFSFNGNWSGLLNLYIVEDYDGSLTIELTEYNSLRDEGDWVLTAYPNQIFDYRGGQSYEHPVAEDFSLFRRCCWLSGQPVEATAHEKAEWLLEFSSQDIKTWNLKF